MKKGLLFILVFSIMVMTSLNAYSWSSSKYLPLGRSWAEGKELPLPLGISGRYYYQDQPYILSQLWINDEENTEEGLDTIDVTNETAEYNLKLDVWLLPFLNLFGLLGTIEGNTVVDFAGSGEDMDIDYDGWMWGTGLTVATGMGKFFSTVSAIYTDCNLDITTSTVNAWILSPSVGVKFEEFWVIDNISVWAGAMYQKAEERHEGDIEVPLFGQIHYKVKLRQREAWNYQVGVNTEITKHIWVDLDGGFGNRRQLSGSIMYRF